VVSYIGSLQAWFKDPSKKLSPAEKIVDDNAVVLGRSFPNMGFLMKNLRIRIRRRDDPAHSRRTCLSSTKASGLSTIDICNGQRAIADLYHHNLWDFARIGNRRLLLYLRSSLELRKKD
jgi:hypothetical protein